jgi:hypothetical protein
MAQISGVLVLAVYHTYKLSVDFIPQKEIRLCDNTHSEKSPSLFNVENDPLPKFGEKIEIRIRCCNWCDGSLLISTHALKDASNMPIKQMKKDAIQRASRSHWSGSRRGALGNFSQESGELYADKRDALNDYEVYVRWTNPARLLLF